MYEADGICYAENKEPCLRIKEAKLLRGNVFLVTFNTGEHKIFDPSVLKGSAYSPLKDETVLKNFTLFHGVLSWCNTEIDVAPETVYAESVDMI